MTGLLCVARLCRHSAEQPCLTVSVVLCSHEALLLILNHYVVVQVRYVVVLRLVEGLVKRRLSVIRLLMLLPIITSCLPHRDVVQVRQRIRLEQLRAVMGRQNSLSR